MTTIGPPPPQAATPRRTPLIAVRVENDLWTGPAFVDLVAGIVTPGNDVSGFLEDAGADSSSDGKAPTQASVFNGHGLFYGLTVDAAAGPAEDSPEAMIRADVATRTTAAPVDVGDLTGLQSARSRCRTPQLRLLQATQRLNRMLRAPRRAQLPRSHRPFG